MGAIRIRPVADLLAGVTDAVDRHRAEILRVLPGSELEHVGATAVPGAVTKGDVDILVRVQAADFEDARAALGALYEVHQPHNWTATLASFVDPRATDLPVGIQLVVTGSSDDDLFVPFRDALRGDPALLADYNALKLGLDGQSYQRYTDRKAEFIGHVLRDMGRGN